MKKILFPVAVLAYCLLVAISSNAQQINVPAVVKNSFTDIFKGAQCSKWMLVRDSYIASFTDGQTYKEAYFTDDGEFKGIGHYITADVLPMHVQTKLSDRYKGYELAELYQFDCVEDGICFYAVLKNQRNEVIAKLNAYGDVTFTKKNKNKQNSMSEPLIASKDQR